MGTEAGLQFAYLLKENKDRIKGHQITEMFWWV